MISFIFFFFLLFRFIFCCMGEEGFDIVGFG